MMEKLTEISTWRPLRFGIPLALLPLICFVGFAFVQEQGWSTLSPLVNDLLFIVCGILQLLVMPAWAGNKMAWADPKPRIRNAVAMAIVVAVAVSWIAAQLNIPMLWLSILPFPIVLSAVFGAHKGLRYEPPYVMVHRLYMESKTLQNKIIDAGVSADQVDLERYQSRMVELMQEAQRVNLRELESLYPGWGRAFQEKFVNGLQNFVNGAQLAEATQVDLGVALLEEYDRILAIVQKKVRMWINS